jgi:hypothetical protein
MVFGPFNFAMGIAQGRIQPAGFIPEQDWSACLGSDIAGQIFRMKGGSYVEVSQLADRDTKTTVKIVAHLRSVRMPTIVRVTNPPTLTDYDVTINTTTFTYTAVTGDTAVVVADELVKAIQAGSEPVSSELLLDAASAHALLSVLPDDADDDLSVAVGPGMSTTGALWRFQLLIDGAERASQVLETGRNRDRVELGANLVGLSGGDHTLSFRLILETGALAPIPVELPAVYIDPVVFLP